MTSAPITARASGPPRVWATRAIAVNGPISVGLTPAMAHSGSGTTVRPTPNPMPMTGKNSPGKYDESAFIVATDTISQPTMMTAPLRISQRGAMRVTNCEARNAAAPSPKANGTNARPACNGLYPRMSWTNSAT